MKKEKANETMNRLIAEYPFLSGKIDILDVWTPATYHRYCNSYKGADMSFVITKKTKDMRVPGTIKGIENVYVAS